MPTPADVYEDVFAKGLFLPWAERIVGDAALERGARVLDVACGTGAGARIAARIVGDAALVCGADVNEQMIQTARERAPAIDWRVAPADSLGFADGMFDVTLCLYGLMFFPDKVGALAEMRRVTKPGGRVIVATWAGHEHCRGMGALAETLRRTFGEEIARGLHVPFSLGDAAEVEGHFRAAGLTEVSHRALDGDGRFASLREWMTAVIRGWMDFKRPYSEEEFETLMAAARESLAEFVLDDGRVVFPMRGLVFTARV